MTYLFGQVWLWMLLAFLLGAIVAWLLDKLFRKPRTAVTEERFFMGSDETAKRRANTV